MSFTSDIRSDFQRYSVVGARPVSVLLFCQGFWAAFTYRASRWLLRRLNFFPLRPLAGFFGRCAMKWMEILTGVSLPPQCEIGPGLYIPHYGTIVLNGRARVGRHCTIHQGVTLGTSGKSDRDDCPVLGDRVYIGVNATLIGRITVGDDAVIGAGAVVTRSVPARAVVVGNPAAVVSRKGSFAFVRYVGMEDDAGRRASLAEAEAERADAAGLPPAQPDAVAADRKQSL